MLRSGTILAIFLSISHPDASYQVSSQLAFWFRRRSESGHPGFLIGIILTSFYLLINLMLPTKFQVKWSFGSGEEAGILDF